MTNEEKKEVNEEIVNNETVEVKREIKAPSEIKEKKEEVVDADNDGFIDKDPGMFYEEMKEESSKEEPKAVAEDVKVEEKKEVVDADNDGFIDKDPGMFYEEMKEESNKVEVETKAETTNVEEVKEEAKVEKVIENPDNSINNVVKAAEEKVAMNNAENGKNIELANNIVKEGKIEENKNLPADIKPILDVIKEKLKAAGKVITNVLEMVGDMVEGIFKKKN